MSNLCEQGFSTLVNIKINKRIKHEFVEKEMRICLSKIGPRIKNVCNKNTSSKISLALMILKSNYFVIYN